MFPTLLMNSCECYITFCPEKKIWWILTACKLNLKLTDDDLENFVSFIYDLDLESYIKKTCLQLPKDSIDKDR